MIRTQSARRLPSEALKTGGISEESNSELNDQLKVLQIELAKVITKPSNFFDDSIIVDFRNTCTLTTRVNPFILIRQQDACEFMVEFLKIEPFYQDANFIQVDKHYKEGTSVIEKSIQEQADVFERGSREFPDEKGNKLNHSNNAFVLTRVTNFSLPIPIKFNISEKQVTGSLNECFDSYFTPELMELASDNPKHGYLKQLSVYKWPKLLVICLSRFGGTKTENPSYNPANPKQFPRYRFNPSKNATPIDVPLHFIRDDQCYRLHGIVTHHGESIEQGHYTAYVYSKVEGRWYHYNDRIVSVHNNYNDFKDLINKDQYILVYEKNAQEECGLVVKTPRPTGPISGKSSFPPTPSPQVPSTTAEVEFCRDPIVSDPVPSTALALPEIPWDRNLPNPGTNDCWFNSPFQILARTPIAHEIVRNKDAHYSTAVLNSLHTQMVSLFTKPDYFLQRGQQGCSIIREEYAKNTLDPENKIGAAYEDKAFIADIVQIEPFKGQTIFDDIWDLSDDNNTKYIQTSPDNTFVMEAEFNLPQWIEDKKFEYFPNLYIVYAKMLGTYSSVPQFFMKGKYRYSLFGFTILFGGGGHYASMVKNLKDDRWYYYDDVKPNNATCGSCVNCKHYKHENEAPVFSFTTLDDALKCDECNIFGINMYSDGKLDQRSVIVYMKDALPNPLIKTLGASEESKAGELEDVREIPWDQNLPNPSGKNDCWFNSVLQVMLRLDCAKEIVHEHIEAGSSEYLVELHNELTQMFQEKDYFSKRHASGRSSARCNAAIERIYTFDQQQTETDFLKDILELEPFKRETSFRLDFVVPEVDEHVYTLGFHEMFDFNFKQTYEVPELKVRNRNHTGNVTFINLTNVLPIIAFIKLPNVFIIDLARCFVVGGVPEFFMNDGGAYYTLFGFTIMHDKSNLGTHYSAVVKNKNQWFCFDDGKKDVKRYDSYQALEQDKDTKIYFESNILGKVDQRSMLVYIRQVKEITTASSENDSDEEHGDKNYVTRLTRLEDADG